MDNFTPSSSSSAPPKLINDGKKPAECSSSALTAAEPRSNHQKANNRNIMLQKFQKFQENGKPSSSIGQYAYIPKPFFFYGSLTDPLRLQEVLQLAAPPVLTPARVKSYKVMLWGQYPALVIATSDSCYVDGMACMIETEQQQQMLAHYETDVYTVAGIRVIVGGGNEVVSGRTFMWAGDPTDLTEGTWSLEEWKKEVEEEMASHFRPVED